MRSRERSERVIERANAKTAAKPRITFSAAADALPFGTLRVVRRLEGRTDRRRLYELWIDGGLCTTLSPGETVEAYLPPGQHMVHLQIDWCRSRQVPVVIAADQTFVLMCAPAANVFTAVLYITVLCRRYIKVRVLSSAIASP